MADPVVHIPILPDLSEWAKVPQQINSMLSGVAGSVKLPSGGGGGGGGSVSLGGGGGSSNPRGKNSFWRDYEKAMLNGGMAGAQSMVRDRLASAQVRLAEMNDDGASKGKLRQQASWINFLKARDYRLERLQGDQIRRAQLAEQGDAQSEMGSELNAANKGSKVDFKLDQQRLAQQERMAAQEEAYQQGMMRDELGRASKSGKDEDRLSRQRSAQQEKLAKAEQRYQESELGKRMSRADAQSKKEFGLDQQKAKQQADFNRKRGIAERKLEGMPPEAQSRIQELTTQRMARGVDYLQAMKEATAEYKQEAAGLRKTSSGRQQGGGGRLGNRIFMQAMFGAWELSRAFSAKMLMDSPVHNRGAVMTLQNQQQAIHQMSSGIFGSIVRGGVDFVDAMSMWGGASTANAQRGFGILGRWSPLAADKAQLDAMQGINGIGATSKAMAAGAADRREIDRMNRESPTLTIRGGFARQRQQSRDARMAAEREDDDKLEQLRINLNDARTLGDPNQIFAAQVEFNSFYRNRSRRADARRARSNAEEKAIAQEQDFQNSLINNDLNTRNSVVDRSLQHNQIGAQSSRLLGGIMGQFLNFVDGRTPKEMQGEERDYAVAKRMLATGNKELEAFKTEYLRSFRGEQFDLRNIAISPNDTENPAKVLQAIATDVGQIIGAMKDLTSN